MTKELKPCPFCGGEARLDKEHHILSCGNIHCYVSCYIKGIGEDAIDIWNTRQPSTLKKVDEDGR